MSNAQSSSTNTLRLVADSAALPPFWAQAVYVGLSVFTLIALTIQQFIDKSVPDALLFICIVALFTGGVMYFIKRANKNMQLTVDSERIHNTDDSSISRTAHFSQIKSLRLTGSSLYIWYSGGSKERFMLPKHSDAEYTKLKEQLQKSANQNGADFEEKRNWI